jgi:ribosomal protein S18 acetylase RimI-like enzyme
MIVVEQGRYITGFLQLIDQKDGQWLIDLIGVRNANKGQGIASQLIQYCVDSCENVQIVKVGTQLANRSSIRLYERIGFRFEDASYVFHFHTR